MMSWTGLHKFADVIFGITQKPLYITTSNSVRKIKLTFLRLFDNSLSKYLFLKKNFFCVMAVFVLFTKIKKWSGTSFSYTFSALFSYKNVLYLILYQWTKFQCHTFFPSQDIKQNVLLSPYLDSWWCHKL